MAGATHLQEQRACIARRVLAVVTGLWFVACGVLGAAHEANVAHVVDARTGEVFHGTAIAGTHTSDQSDVHRAEGTPDHDACTLVTALHQPATSAVAHVHVATLPHVRGEADRPAPRALFTARATYREAPKTSPPPAA